MDDIELQEIAKSMEDLISQLSQTDVLSDILHTSFWGWSIRGLLKVEVAKKVQLQEHIKKRIASLMISKSILEFTAMTNSKRLGIELKD